MIASDIGFGLGVTTRQASSHLRLMVSEGIVNSNRPQKHLGDRFPITYWISNDPLTEDD